MCERNINRLPLARPNQGPACNPGVHPDWESTSDPSVHRLELCPLSHASQGSTATVVFICRGVHPVPEQAGSPCAT